ncbi:hypothetical protein RJ639_026732 [Escallonia herrerae]|uniref:Alpha-carbonic anhydrase domain-containing protein n=1 Tax=Escallonia herrerae TaxID=1293975 RepID=A0AA88XEQ6_9ASTE|nr:hypothetical protein RJ639_026732 [Escallonia herrerae]
MLIDSKNSVFSHFSFDVAIDNGAEDEREFNYAGGSAKGPAHWGELRSEWSMCNSGRMQSPIDLLNERVETVFDLELHLVHESTVGKIAVVGIMYKIGRANTFLSMVRTVTKEQVKLIREAVHDDSETNARPLQPTNKLSVKLYRPRVREEN